MRFLTQSRRQTNILNAEGLSHIIPRRNQLEILCIRQNENCAQFLIISVKMKTAPNYIYRRISLIQIS